MSCGSEYKSKRVLTNNNKKEEIMASGVYLNKLMGLSSGFNSLGLITLDKFMVNSANPDEKPSAAFFMVFGFNIKNIQPLYENGTRVCIVADPGIYDYETLKETDTKEKNLRILWVQKNVLFRNSAFHPKLYIFKFEKFIRICIGSANLFMEDWAKWSNVTWVRNFPLRVNSSTTKNTGIRQQLENFIKISLGSSYADMKAFVNIDLKDYDFSESNVELLYSVPTKKTWLQNEPIALEQLSSIMMQNPPTKPYDFKDTRVYYSCSCVGVINFGTVYQFVTAIAPNLNQDKKCDSAQQKKFSSLLKLIYPTKSYINGVNQKDADLGCLFFNRRIYSKVNFNSNILAQFENNEPVYGDEHIVSHGKIFIVLRNGKVDDDTVIYIGSHNFTKSAWGKMSNKRYEVSNYELGVLYPPKANSAELKREIIEKFSFKIPAARYREDDEPFFTTEK